jgi:hypothetical protein
MARKKQPQESTTDLAAQSVALAEFADKALVAAEQSGVKKKPIPDFTLDNSGHAIAADLPGLSATLKRKLKKKDGTFTVADTASILMAPVDPKAMYPLCLEGARACPPEDCGSVWGYGDFLEAIANPKHEEHKSMLEWVGGRFDPEGFDAATATKAMKKGLPDWRSMR